MILVWSIDKFNIFADKFLKLLDLRSTIFFKNFVVAIGVSTNILSIYKLIPLNIRDPHQVHLFSDVKSVSLLDFLSYSLSLLQPNFPQHFDHDTNDNYKKNRKLYYLSWVQKYGVPWWFYSFYVVQFVFFEFKKLVIQRELDVRFWAFKLWCLFSLLWHDFNKYYIILYRNAFLMLNSFKIK